MRFVIRRTDRMQSCALAILLIAGLLCGCETESPVEALGGALPDSPGVGSLTLKVVAAAEGRDSGAGTYATDFVVTVHDTLGAPVSGAGVAIAGAFGVVVLSEDALSTGTYRATRGDYEAGSYTLRVVAGSDSLSGVTTHAPAIPDITSPAPGDTVTASTARLLVIRFQ